MADRRDRVDAHDIGTSANFSNPIGRSRQDMIPQGMTQNPVIGTATALATME